MLSTLLQPDGGPGAAPFLDLRWIDTVGLVVVLVGVLLGALRGLWWQVFRLVGVVAAVAVARAATPGLVPRLRSLLTALDPRVAYGIVWVLVFVAVLLCAALVGRLGRSGLKAMQLSTVDRVGGACAGALTGALLHLALVVAMQHLGGGPWLSGTYSMAATEAIGARLPRAYAADERAPHGVPREPAATDEVR
jgi:uncharacterized membrane protein required for colicin V production